MEIERFVAVFKYLHLPRTYRGLWALGGSVGLVCYASGRAGGEEEIKADPQATNKLTVRDNMWSTVGIHWECYVDHRISPANRRLVLVCPLPRSRSLAKGAVPLASSSPFAHIQLANLIGPV